MPWIRNGTQEEFVMPEPNPFTLPPGVEDGSKEANAYLFAHRSEFRPWWKRLMAEWFEFHKCCPRKACRRARVCSDPAVGCFEAAEPFLREDVYPKFKEYLRKHPPSARAPT